LKRAFEIELLFSNKEKKISYARAEAVLEKEPRGIL
jgi:hypothetical protein